MNTQLSKTQQLILNHAATHADGKLDWFPDTVKGGALQKVIANMMTRGLIVRKDDDWFINAENYNALFAESRAPITLAALENCIATAEAAQHGASQVLADEIGSDDPTDAEIDDSNDIDPEIEAVQHDADQVTTDDVGSEVPTADEVASSNAIENPTESESEIDAGNDTPLDHLFSQIARKHPFVETLETQNSDSLDFHDVSVWGIKSTLQAAFDAGVQSASKVIDPELESLVCALRQLDVECVTQRPRQIAVTHHDRTRNADSAI